jgi:GINS complex subunit 4
LGILIHAKQIDKYAVHYNKQAENDPELLSSLEQDYLREHQQLLSEHYAEAFLKTFPDNLQGLEDTTGGITMVDKPDEEGAVFCRVLRDAGRVPVYGETATTDVELRRGDLWLLRWSAIKDAVLRGDVELV